MLLAALASALVVFSDGRDVFTRRLADGQVRNLTHSPKPWLANTTPALSPDGKLIAFSRSTDAFNTDIFLMTTTGKIVRRLTHTVGTDSRLGEEHGPAWSPDGRTIAFVSNRSGGSWDIYTVRVDGTHERRVTATPRVDEDAPRFRRDGTLVYSRRR